MASQADIFLEKWHKIVAERDREGLREILCEDISFAPPPYHQRMEGIDLVHHLLGIIIETIEGFTYYREWVSDRELALEFKGQVDGLDLQGIDLITLDETGRVAKLDVMVRPLNAVTALRERVAPQMAAFLKERAEAAASS